MLLQAHRAHARAAAGHDEIGRARVQQDAGQDAVHHIGQRGLILGRIHSVVEDVMAQRLRDGGQGGVHRLAFGGLAVFDDKSDLNLEILKTVAE